MAGFKANVLTGFAIIVLASLALTMRYRPVEVPGTGFDIAIDTAVTPLDTAGSVSSVRIVGEVRDFDGRPQADVVVMLSALNEKDAVIWRSSYRTEAARGKRGYFQMQMAAVKAHLPKTLRLTVPRQRVSTGNLVLKWPGDTSAALVVNHVHQWSQADSTSWTAADIAAAGGHLRYDFQLEYDPTPPTYTFLLFLPALVGLAIGTGVLIYRRLKDGKGKDARGAIRIYVAVGTSTWVIVVAYFVVGYWIAGLRSISFLDPSISIPVLVPVAAFLGVLVYVTTLLAKNEGTEEELGNRVLIAPYVAIIAILALFQGKTDGLLPPFIAFFTGLWIDPVLTALHTAGTKIFSLQKADTPRDPPPAREGSRSELPKPVTVPATAVTPGSVSGGASAGSTAGASASPGERGEE